MNSKNISPKKMQKPANTSQPNPAKSSKKGLDEWNDRLDKNLETEKEGNELSDENAKEYSYEKGSGDQSDEALGIQK